MWSLLFLFALLVFTMLIGAGINEYSKGNKTSAMGFLALISLFIVFPIVLCIALDLPILEF